MQYKTAQAWRDAAMQREHSIDEKEVESRRQIALRHVMDEDKSISSDVWDDYMLYILGKMEKDEYQAYLLFKYSGESS